MLSAVLVPIHRAGWPFVAVFFAFAVILGFIWTPLFWVGLLLTAWCVYFFRDPARTTPIDPSLVTSPADGIVCTTRPRVPPPELGLGSSALPCIGIFMNVFDVHVNRTPVPGRIMASEYHKGQFLNASFDKASDLNERRSWRIRTAQGKDVGLVQIAGLVARRIVEIAKPGDEVEAGQRVGLIRFGSRCDVYLPVGTVPLVAEGQRMIAGETVLADLMNRLPQRLGRTT